MSKQRNRRTYERLSFITQKFVKMIRFAKEESRERHEFQGSGFSEIILLDTVVPHKKRDNITAKVILSI